MIIKKLLLKVWRFLNLPLGLKNIVLYIINYKFIVGVLAIITDDKGKVLLFHHTYIKHNPWGMPGGAAKKEDLRVALQRELIEETRGGFEIKINHLIGAAQGYKRQLLFVFSCSLEKDKFNSSDEVSGFDYFSLDNLPPIEPTHKEILDYLARKTNTWPFVDPNIKSICIPLGKRLK